jgi:hypothetical protein
MGLRLVIQLETYEDAAREWECHFSQGGAFVRGASAERSASCTVVLVDPLERELELAGLVVYSGPEGVGVQLDNFGADLRDRIETWLNERERDDDDPETRDPAAHNVYERIRNLPIAQQLKLAREGELAERIALERIYGKTVWEALLRNTRITPPEVARIARMGQLPRPLLELIVSTTAWLRAPEVRRALLSNPKLSADMIARVLRLLPKHELKLVPSQTAYPQVVRNTAKMMLKESG